MHWDMLASIKSNNWLNDSGCIFDEIAVYLDRTGNGRLLARYNFIDTTLFDLPYVGSWEESATPKKWSARRCVVVRGDGDEIILF
jgi:hypothetical protein